MLVHSVFFYLQPGLSPEQKTQFHRAVETLGDIQSAAAVYVGTPANTPDRPVIDKSYDVGLTVVLESLAAHDAYQDDPIHQKFIEEYREWWTKVVIYDAD